MELVKLIFMILVWLLQLWLIPWVRQFMLFFVVAPSENSSSIDSHLDHLEIGSNPSYDLYGSISCDIMIDEGFTLVKVASSISDYNYCLCSFQFFIFLYGYTFYVSTLYVIYILKFHFVVVVFLMY